MAKSRSQSTKEFAPCDRTVVRGRTAGGLFERISAHDRFQVEVKRNYVPGHAQPTRYELFTYLFLPNSLGISPRTYAPDDFYRDLQNYVRLRTPRLTPKQIFESAQSPIVLLSRLAEDATASSRTDRIVSNLKLLHPVAKIAVSGLTSSAASEGGPGPDAYLDATQRAFDFWEAFLSRLRGLREPLAQADSPEVDAAYRLVDEALSLLAEQTLLERYQGLEELDQSKKIRKLRTRIRNFAAAEQHRREEQRAASGVPPMKDEELLERLSLLKKYSSEVLFLTTERRPEGKTIEHLALAGAAGLAMAFATAVTFFSQRFWSNFSVELFLAFVCGYMFKDRIKEVARGWLGALLNKRLDDHRLLLRSRDGKRQLGYIRERVRFLGLDEVPAEVLRKRRSWTEHALLDAAGVRGEVVLLHRREVVFDPAAVTAPGERTHADGLSDISRLDIRSLLAKMDDPRSKRRRFRGDVVETVRYQRTYPVYLITATRANPSSTPMVVSAARILLNRKGVRGIESVDEESALAA